MEICDIYIIFICKYSFFYGTLRSRTRLQITLTAIDEHAGVAALTNAADSSIAHTYTLDVEENEAKLKRRREREREARHNQSE